MEPITAVSAPEVVVIPSVGVELVVVKLEYPAPTVKVSVPAPRYTFPTAKTNSLVFVVMAVVTVGVLEATPFPALFVCWSNGAEISAPDTS